MGHLSPHKWTLNNFVTYLSHQGWNSCSCVKKQRNKWGGTRKGYVIVKTPMLCRILWMPRISMLWTILIQNLQGTLEVSILVYRWMVSNLTALIVLRTLADQFSWCPTICLPTNVWRKGLYSLLLWFQVLRSRRSKWIYFCVYRWKR
jgi:hypothetical protein